MFTKKTALILTSCLVIAGIALVACGDGSGGTPTQEAVARTTCKPDQPPVFGTPVNVPTDKLEFQSTERGYTVLYPAGWEAKANHSAIANISADAFLGPVASNSVRVNMSVTCETIPVGTTSREFTDAKMEVLRRAFGGSPSQGEQLTVDGKDAYLIKFAMGSEDTPAPGSTEEPLNAETVQVMFADARGGWTISLLAPEGQLAPYRAFFDELVASFHEM